MNRVTANACSPTPDGAAPASAIWLARHARPLIKAGVCYGQLDVAADQDATIASARSLADALPIATRIVCSPLQRCELLAHTLIGFRADLSYKTDPRLMEMSFGNWEGRRWSDIGRPAIDAWVADFADHRPGGGESAQAVLRRVASLWDEARAAGDTLWITHAGVVRAATLLRAGIRRIDEASQWPVSSLGLGAWAVWRD